MDKEETIATVLKRMENGDSLRAACRAVGVPTTTVFGWLDETVPEQYARARAKLIDFHSEEYLGIADNDELEANDKRVRLDARKWLTSKLMPKRFGDSTTHKGDPDNPIRTIAEVRNVIIDSGNPDS